MRRKFRRSTKQYITVAIISLLVMACSFTILYIITTTNIKDTFGKKVNTLESELYSKRQYVYEALYDIEAGQLLTEDLLVYHEVITEQISDLYMEKEDLGQYALISIPKGSYIQKSMLFSEDMEDKLREVEVQVIQLSKNLNHNDYVDVRIFYPNGENYILLSRKALKIEEDLGAYLWLDEKEILLLSSAVVDAYLYEGAYLYTTKYIEPSVQSASIVTYVPSLSILNLIKENPNIIEEAKEGLKDNVRKELENRLAESQKLDVKEVQWRVDNSKDQEGDSQDYFYYTEEEKANKEEPEYGE